MARRGCTLKAAQRPRRNNKPRRSGACADTEQLLLAAQSALRLTAIDPPSSVEFVSVKLAILVLVGLSEVEAIDLGRLLLCHVTGLRRVQLLERRNGGI